jgi:peptide/nickel transport system substrate-binding protein
MTKSNSETSRKSLPRALVRLMLLVVSFSGCTKSSTSSPLVVVGLSAPPLTLDPRYTTDATGTRIAGLLYSSLIRVGPDLKPIGDAAARWQQDGTHYVFDLKPRLTFSDGHLLSPEDVDASFKTFMSAKSAYASAFKGIKSVHSKTAGDHIQTVVDLSEISATFISDLVSIKLLEASDQSNSPLGSGPFVLESQSPNDIILKSRADHPYAVPKIPGVDFKIVRDDNTREMKMLKGEIDLAQAEFPAMKIAQLEKSDRLKVYKYPGLALTYLLLNLRDPFLAKLANRKAMASAIDRHAIVQYKLDGLAIEATSLLTPINPFFDSSLKSITPSTRDAIAHEVSPELILKTSSAPAAVENGRILANDLKKADFKVKVQSFEWGTFFGDVQAGRFQLATMRWVGTIDPDLYRKALNSREVPPIGRNRGFYANPDVDRWTEDGFRTTDFTKRKIIYDKIQKAVFNDLPFIPLWYDTEVAVVSRRLQNYEPPLDGSFWILTKVEKK